MSESNPFTMPSSSDEAASTESNTGNIGRLVKSLVFAACLLGFVYQVVEFCAHFLKYPTVINIDVQSADAFQLPAITFCNTNPVQRTKFCNKYSARCEIPKDLNNSFCPEYPQYCQRNAADFRIPKIEYQPVSLKPPLGLTVKDINELHQNSYEFDITSARTENYEFIKNSTRNIQRIFLDVPGKGLRSCYTDHALFANKLDPPLKEFDDDISKPFAMYILNVQPDQYFRPADKRGVRFAVHSPFEATNPFRKGIPMVPGHAYKIRIQFEEELLLPYPFKTDCISYYDQWIKNGKSSPRSQEMCKDNCRRDFNKACFGCQKKLSVYLEKDEICEMHGDIICNATEPEEMLTQNFEFCMNQCKKNCKKLKYSYTFEEMTEYLFEALDLILITITVHSPEIKVLSHKPQYENVEIFSYVGGFMGCWLGLSLWNVSAFIDMVTESLKAGQHRTTESLADADEEKKGSILTSSV